MTLRPTISRVVEQKEDPAVSIVSRQTQKSLIPQVQVREYDSVVYLQSGMPIVYAGLMIDEGNADESGIPEVSDIPLLGSLFKGKSSGQRKTELVIWIKAEIMPPLGSYQGLDPHDQKVYETFIQDPRPFASLSDPS
jgi:general secretion pathway protein D